MVGENTLSQPLTLIECIRCVLKGLEMFSEYLCRGFHPKREGSSPLLGRPQDTPTAPPSDVSKGDLTQWPGALG